MSHSIRELIDRDERVPVSDLFHLYDNLVKEAVNSRIHEIPGEMFEQGEMISIDIENLTVPRIDFFTGEIEHMGIDFEHFPVYVSFNGMNGPVETLIDIETSTPERLNVVVPDQAITGKINLLLPAVEVFNPEKLFFREEISTEQEHCLCRSEELEITEDNLRDLILLKLEDMESLEETVFYPMFGGFFIIRCKCKVNCPNNAIKYDQYGYCYVDPKLCEGQKYYRHVKKVGPNKWEDDTYEKDGRIVHKRSSEFKCWKCFDQNTCSLLRKVVYLDSSRCCGDCDKFSQLRGKYIKDLCKYGAITGGRPVRSPWEPLSYYSLDPEKCVGCMECYNGLTCRNNHSTTSHTVHAVAYIPKTHATLTLKSISYRLKGFLTQSQNFQDYVATGYAQYLHRYNEPKQYRLELFGKKRKSVKFNLMNNQCSFSDSLDFVGKAALELFENDTPKGFYVAFNNKSRNLDTVQIPAMDVKGGHVDFETPKGIFRLEYDVKTHP